MTSEKIIYHKPSEASWDFSGVLYRGKTIILSLFGDMTTSLSQDELAKLREKEKSAGNPYPANAQEIWAIASQAYELREECPNTAEQVRQVLQNGMQQYPNTLSRLVYDPDKELDQVIHNYGTSDAYTLEENIIGPARRVIAADNLVLEKVLGDSDYKHVQNVGRWINKTDFWIWRDNPKPKKRTERVARFVAGSGRAGLGCDGDLRCGYPAFRVVIGE
jgi:hypothetical protein